VSLGSLRRAATMRLVPLFLPTIGTKTTA
jgi:hypothetical protein